MLKVVDLYCGAGLFSAGFRTAGFQIIMGVDRDPVAVSSFRDSFPDAVAWCADVRDLPSIPECDVLIGGPPCQPFSSANRSRDETPDPSMVDAFVRLAKASGARWVIMEEVPGVVSVEAVHLMARSMVLSCSSMGALNDRSRLFVGRYPDPVPRRPPVMDPAPCVLASDSSVPLERMRELQGVPSWMVINGTDMEVRRQIGNGVPIPVGEAFGLGILGQLRGISGSGHLSWHRTTASFYRSSRSHGGNGSYLSAEGWRFCLDCRGCVPLPGRGGTPSPDGVGTPSQPGLGTPGPGRSGTPKPARSGTPLDRGSGVPDVLEVGVPSGLETGVPSSSSMGTPSTRSDGTPDECGTDQGAG